MNRLRQILTFLGIFALILGSTHVYMVMRIGYYLQLGFAARNTLACVFSAFVVLVLAALPLSRVLPRRAASVLSWLVYPWMGIALILFTTLAATDILWALLHLVPDLYPPQREPEVQFGFGVVALVVAGVLSIVAVFNGLAPVRVKRVDVTLARLPQSFDGLRAVQITDLHIGPLISGTWMQAVVDKVNALNPDVVFITGDMVDGSVAELRPHVAPIAGLRAKHGVFFVTGNHEYYAGADEWCAHLSTLGIRVLRNERVSISNGVPDETIDVAGVDDWRTRHYPGGANLGRALAGRDATAPVVLLAHQPAAVDEAAQAGVDLQLSGHTHAGQIWPFTYLVRIDQPYTKGLQRHTERTQIYISPGTGFWGPPMRLGTTAEITELTLHAK